jgi:Ca2+-binding RTX toxin-like protein
VRRPLILMALMAATVLLVSGVAYALSVQCDGVGDQDPATGQCQGTDEDDSINGTAKADIIFALGGLDFVSAGAGRDELDGGILGDELAGDAGRDIYFGGDGADALSDFGSNSGNDVMNGGDGNDVLLAGSEGNDVLKGQAGNEHCPDCIFIPGARYAQMFGGPGNDRLSGGSGKDGMEGQQGSDVLKGGPQDDRIDAAVEETVGTPDTVNGGNGFDFCIVNENDTVANCERTQTEPNPTAASAASSKEDTTNK